MTRCFWASDLGGVNALDIAGERAKATRRRRRGGLSFQGIAAGKRPDLTGLPVGRNVVVIGGGMTAVDAAVQCKLLGAENVTMAYRRGTRADECFSEWEQDLATRRRACGSSIRQRCRWPCMATGAAQAMWNSSTLPRNGLASWQAPARGFRISADQVLSKAIGQT